MTKCWVLVFFLVCCTQWTSVFGDASYSNLDDRDGGSPEDALQLVPYEGGPLRDRRSYKKWGEFAGGFGAAVAPHLWNMWKNRGKRSSADDNIQYDPEILRENVGDFPEREKRSWFAAASLALPFIPKIIDHFRGKRGLEDSIQWNPNEQFLGDFPIRKERNVDWGRVKNKFKKFGRVVGEYGVPLVGTFAPLAYDHYKNRGKRNLDDVQWNPEAFESSISNGMRKRSSESVMVSDRRFDCNNSFCANKDGLFEIGLCSTQVCRCEGGKAKIEDCKAGLVFDALTMECKSRSSTLCGLL